MIDPREPIVTPVPVEELRPTQITVGMREVELKRQMIRAQDAKKKTGETVSGSLDSFKSFVEKKTSEIRKQHGCTRVEYIVEVQDGKVKLRARAKV